VSGAVVIGRGVIGCAVALELARDGWDVTAIDRHGAVGHGSTSGSSGGIRFNYSTRDGCALAWEGCHAWADLAAHVGAPEDAVARYHRSGFLALAHEGNRHWAPQRSICDALGIPWAWWDAEAIRARLPFFDLARYAPPKRPDQEGFGEPTGGALEGGVYWPDAGYVADPMLAAQNLWDAAERHGARALRGEVTGFCADGRVRAVALADGTEIAADVIVNAAGPASGKVNRMAGVTGDMRVAPRPMRQHVVHLPAAPGQEGMGGLVVLDDDAGVYSRPERGGVLVGSIEPDCDVLEWVEDGEAFDRTPGDQWDAQAMRYGQRVPTLGIPRRRAGVVECYDVTPDWIPIYDRSSLPGFYMACGTSGNQFKNAVVVGELMAALIAYEAQGGDHDTAPLRWTLPRTGNEIDLGFYSRQRRPNPASSGTVLG
jgi:sarcosine oxidase subunit beta